MEEFASIVALASAVALGYFANRVSGGSWIKGAVVLVAVALPLAVIFDLVTGGSGFGIWIIAALGVAVMTQLFMFFFGWGLKSERPWRPPHRKIVPAVSQRSRPDVATRSVSERLIAQVNPFMMIWESADAGPDIEVWESVVTSSDSQRVACVARGDSTNRQWVVAVDRQEETSLGVFDTNTVIEKVSAYLSPDGQRIAYAVHVSDAGYMPKDYLYVDGHVVSEALLGGEESYLKSHMGRGGFRESGYIGFVEFSPDSRRLAHLVSYHIDSFSKGECSLFVDGQEQHSYDGVTGFAFSPDSQRVAYVARSIERKKGLLWDKKVGERGMVVIDGHEGGQYDGIVAPPEGRGIIFDSPRQLHYIAEKGSSLYLVEERLD